MATNRVGGSFAEFTSVKGGGACRPRDSEALRLGRSQSEFDSRHLDRGDGDVRKLLNATHYECVARGAKPARYQLLLPLDAVRGFLNHSCRVRFATGARRE